ncbi:MAG TPA: hypothetical protein VMT37_08850 [Solirubrobacterales bacterium]|nr:hypothetical protein [Solirubrobacterales bacterium]
MSLDQTKPLPKVPDPRHLEEHGVTIPAPTPTSISIPNPWKPPQDGAAQSNGSSGNGSSDSAKSD